MPYLVKYTLKRLGLLILTAFIILTITFFLVKMLPVGALAGTEVQQYTFAEKEVADGYFIRLTSTTTKYGDLIFHYVSPDGQTFYYYRNPIILQYGAWLKGIFTQWNWGLSSSIQPQTSAMVIIGERLKPTIIINIVALLISLPLGFIFGIIAALNKNNAIDNTISTVVMIFISVPSFVTISILMIILCYQNQVLPSSWPSAGAPTEAYLKAMVIPVLSLAVGTVAVFTRYTRAELTEVMSSEFLLLARTKGLTKSQCVVRHALRNSMVPIVPMVIGEFIGILGGSMVLEQLYSINGIGQLFVTCLTAKDYNVLLVDMAVFTMIDLVANLLVDLSYGIVDPRIRMGAKAA
jgi:oligopeptide transport system permease protein